VNRPPAALMDRLAALLGDPSGDAEELGGGITNRNYRVRLGGADYVVRVTSPESSLLGIDRRCEHAAAVAAAALGVAPRVAAFLEDAGCLVTEFLSGRPLPPEELREPGPLAAVARTVRAVHDGAPCSRPASPGRGASPARSHRRCTVRSTRRCPATTIC